MQARLLDRWSVLWPVTAAALVFLIFHCARGVTSSGRRAASAAAAGGMLSSEQVDDILSEASEMLRPLGITKKDLQRLHRNRAVKETSETRRS